MGHASIATTQRYADHAPRHDERQLVQDALSQPVTMRPSSLALREVARPTDRQAGWPARRSMFS
jgi:hypothetical protein